MDIKLQRLTWDDILSGEAIENDDHFLFAEDFLLKRKDIFLKNPNLEDKSVVAAYLIRSNGSIIGHLFPFPTKIKAGDQIVKATSASNLLVLKEYEKYAVGADLVMAPFSENYNKAIVFSGITPAGMGCYKALKFKDFALPKMMQPHTAKFILQNYGLHGALLKVVSLVCNIFLKPYIALVHNYMSRFSKQYRVVRLEIVPDWVDDMVMNDGHKYMEVHDHKWLQWCLDNSFPSVQLHKKFFFAIYDKNDKAIGFFLNDEEETAIPSRNINNLKQGTLMEWGSFDEDKLSETDIIKIAVTKFSKEVDLIQFASMNKSVLKHMKKYGFMHHNYHHIVFKDLSKLNNDAGNSDLWRLRFGYADTLF